MFAGFYKLYSVRFETLREHFLPVVYPYAALSVALKEGSLDRVRKPVTRCLLMIDDNAIYQQICLMSFDLLPCACI